MGIKGEIISTPSYSDNSIGLILDSGECCIGDFEPYKYLDIYENKKEL